MLIMGDSSYQNHAGRTESRPSDWTPYSAVSSFNLPATCDSSLSTPNTTMNPQYIPSRMAPIKQEAPSPSTGSSYQFYADDGFPDMRCRSPMKFREPSTQAPTTSSAETEYPPSPYFINEPYYGNYSVSAGNSSSYPASGMTASPVGANYGHQPSYTQLPLPQPSFYSAGGYRHNNQTPILITPNPRARKPSTTSTQTGSLRQDSLDSSLSTPRSSRTSHGPGESPYLQSQEGTANPQRQQKRKTPSQGPGGDESDGDSSGGDSDENLLLVQLRDKEKLPWKQVQDQFNKRTGQDKKIPCLEMRLKRHRERSRRWTDVDERALKSAHSSYKKNKYEHISHLMLKHGCEDRWTKEGVKKKLEAMYPDGSPRLSNAPVRRRRIGESDLNAWCYRRDSLQDVEGRMNIMPGSNGTNEFRQRLPSEISLLRSQHFRPLQLPSQQREEQQRNQSLPAQQQSIALEQPIQSIWGLDRS
ncbi:hypothetical protein PVAG01_02194 [Phlyctema vagabunda]|uniref:Myb-like domain-containing protein n=1 Tax=Phlyctema vagabunda TaxID=108571 RepID=A0ABR4PPW2_9HELO